MADDDPGIKSLERAVEILNTVQDLEGGQLRAIADATGMAKSTVYRHLYTLEQHGYVVREADTYHVGLRFLDHGMHARTRKDAYEPVEDAVAEVVEVTGDRAQFIVPENGLGVHVYTKVGEHATHTDTRVGKRIYLHSAAAGKAVLAHLPRERVDAILDRHGQPGLTAATVTDRTELYEELDAVADRGYAFHDGERIEGLRSVGVPILDGDEVLGGLSVSGAARRMDGDRLQSELPQFLLGVKDELELKLRY